MPVRSIIVDDEPLAIEALVKLLSRFDEIEIVARCADAFAAFDILQKEECELMFLDINMPEMSGVSFLKSLKSPPKVIFTTAHRDFAIDAFELDAIDYLLKPISYARLMRAINKFHEKSLKSAQMDEARDESTALNHLFVRADRKMVKVMLDDILYIEGLKDYIKIVTEYQTIITKMGMGMMEESLPVSNFLRCHRSYIVNRSKVTAYTNYDIEIRNTEIPISATYRDDVFEKLKSGN